MSTKLKTKCVPTVSIIQGRASIVRVRWGVETKKYEYKARMFATGDCSYHRSFEDAATWVGNKLIAEVVFNNKVLTSTQGV